MRTLSLMEQGLTLAVEGDLLLVERGGATLQRVRLGDVDEVLVFGAVTLTPSATARLLRRGVETVFLSARGRYRGRLAGHRSRNVELRLTQFRRFGVDDDALPLARAIVTGKLTNQRQLLLRAQREHKHEGLAAAIAALRRLTDQVATTTSRDELMGVEGRAAAIYFAALGTCLRNPSFTFTRRTRRPPRDPVNAVLSFGYTMLGFAMEGAVQRTGFDPMLGAFHAPSYGRPSLVLDLIEEFRPVLVDSLMLRLVNRRELGLEDFEDAPQPDEDDDPFVDAGDEGSAEGPLRGVWLSDTGRRVFYRAWGRRLREVVLYPLLGRRFALEDILHQQVLQLARVVRGEADLYVPFTPR